MNVLKFFTCALAVTSSHIATNGPYSKTSPSLSTQFAQKNGGSKQLNTKESLTPQNQNDLNIQGEIESHLNTLVSLF